MSRAIMARTQLRSPFDFLLDSRARRQRNSSNTCATKSASPARFPPWRILIRQRAEDLKLGASWESPRSPRNIEKMPGLRHKGNFGLSGGLHPHQWLETFMILAQAESVYIFSTKTIDSDFRW
jgi:hypothetical protein